jgi:hypothetical protein
MTMGRILAAILLFRVQLTSRAAAQEAATTPAPPPPTSAPAAQNAPVWHNPTGTPFVIFDPCGGPKELISKINPSPCVLVLGQAEVALGYTNINVHGSVGVTAPLQRGVVLPISGNANVYPELFLSAGVSSRSQLSVTLPSDVSISTQRLGSTSAATDPALNYKQLVYFSPTRFTLAAVAVGYTPPTTTTSLGPAYTIQPQLAQPLNLNVSVGTFWTFKNAAVNNADVTQRAWSDPIGFYLAWAPARANFAVLPLLIHNFNPNRTPLVLDALYLFNRHMLLNLAYGGLGASSSTILPSAPNVTFATNVTPRLFTASLYFLLGGESNLPPMPPPPSNH